MALIEASLRDIEWTQGSVNYVIEAHKNLKTKITDLVDEMAIHWGGEDYVQYKAQWQKISGAASNIAVTIRVLEKYAELLGLAVKEYTASVQRARIRFGDIDMIVEEFSIDTKKMKGHFDSIQGLIRRLEALKSKASLLLQEEREMTKVKKLVDSRNLEEAIRKLTKVKNALYETAEDFDTAERLIQIQEEEFTRYLNSTPYGTDYSVICSEVTRLLAAVGPEFFELYEQYNLSQFCDIADDGSITYNWPAIEAALSRSAPKLVHNVFGQSWMSSEPHEISDEQAAALAILYLGMDGDNAEKFLYASMQNATHLGWETSPNVEKVLLFANALVYADSLTISYANEIPAEVYKEKFGGLSRFQGSSAADIKQAVLNDMVDKNSDAMLNLGALDYLNRVDSIDNTYEETLKENLKFSFDYEKNECTIVYKNFLNEGIFNRFKTVIISADEGPLAANNAIDVLESYIGQGEGVDTSAIVGKSLSDTVKSQLKSELLNRAYDDLLAGTGALAKKSTLIGINLTLGILTEIAKAEKATREAGNLITVGEDGKKANVFGLSMVTVNAGGESYGVLYPGSGTLTTINYINDKIMDDEYWSRNQIDPSKRDMIRDRLATNFQGKLTLNDVLNRSKEVQELLDMIPKKMQNDIIEEGRKYTQ